MFTFEKGFFFFLDPIFQLNSADSTQQFFRIIQLKDGENEMKAPCFSTPFISSADLFCVLELKHRWFAHLQLKLIMI